MNRRHFLATTAAAIAASSFPFAARAAYPDRPVRFVVGFAPGGNSDVIARRFADLLGQQLGQSIVVDNKPGAGGAIASSETARAEPDGYTIQLASASTHVTAPLTGKDITFDPLSSFSHVRLLTKQPWAILVNPQVPANSLEELIALIKAEPNKYFYGSGGVGGLAHLTGELFKKLAGGLEIEHVGYQGGAPAIQDAIAGRVQMLVEVVGGSLSYHRSGQLKMLAVCSQDRLEAAPEIPTAVESGVADLISETFLGVTAPAGTPDDVVARLYEGCTTVMNNAEFVATLAKDGTGAVKESTPTEMREYIGAEIEKWRPIVKDLA